MASVQHFIRWIKERSSKRSKNTKNTQEPICGEQLFKDYLRDTLPGNSHASRDAHGDQQPVTMCRASMKLPPLPRGVSPETLPPRKVSQSPYHVYEEIPISAIASHADEQNAHSFNESHNNSISSTSETRPGLRDKSRNSIHNSSFVSANGTRHPTNDCDFTQTDTRNSAIVSANRTSLGMGDLNFALAQECGSYLLVPIRDRANSARLPHDGSDENQFSPSSSAQDFHYPTRQSICSSDVDSGVSFCSQDRESLRYNHCQKCSRPHGIYNGIACAHFGTEDSLRYLDLASLNSESCADSAWSLNTTDLASSSGECRQKDVRLIKVYDAESTDTGNEYDLNSCESASCTNSTCCNQVRTPFVDSDTSIYPVTPVEELSKTGGLNNEDLSRNYNSDSYSEYDIKSDDSAYNPGDEYEYYLSKVRRNRLLEENVQKLAKGSCNMKSKHYQESDTISLTTVTSMSEISTLNEDEIYKITTLERQRCRRDFKAVTNRAQSATNKSQSAFRAVKHNSRGKLNSSSGGKNIEYYKLPEFASSTSSAKLSPAQLDNDHDLSERLSCRVTSYKPPQNKASIPRQKSAGNFVASKTFRTSIGNNNNKLLCDIMRINHDRQLLFL